MNNHTREIVKVGENILTHPSVRLQERQELFKLMQGWPQQHMGVVPGHCGTYDKTGRRLV